MKVHVRTYMHVKASVHDIRMHACIVCSEQNANTYSVSKHKLVQHSVGSDYRVYQTWQSNFYQNFDN